DEAERSGLLAGDQSQGSRLPAAAGRQGVQINLSQLRNERRDRQWGRLVYTSPNSRSYSDDERPHAACLMRPHTGKRPLKAYCRAKVRRRSQARPRSVPAPSRAIVRPGGTGTGTACHFVFESSTKRPVAALACRPLIVMASIAA